jgi:hypothetical protein
MRRLSVLLLVVLVGTLQLSAGKQKGTATLRDFQPAGTTDKKNKTQKFDVSFDAAGNNYTCRTKDKVKATEFVVGHDVTYQLDNDKVKLKNPDGKELKCTVVRVEKLTGSPTTAEAPK